MHFDEQWQKQLKEPAAQVLENVLSKADLFPCTVAVNAFAVNSGCVQRFVRVLSWHGL